MGNLYCPYCEECLGDHVDDCYNADTEYEHECSKCGKNFVFTICYYPSFTSEKADCLNGSEHNFEKINGIPEEVFKNRRRCSMCSKEIKVEGKEK